MIRNNTHNYLPQKNHHSLQQHIHEVLNSKPHKTATHNSQTHPDPNIPSNYKPSIAS